MRIDLAGDSRQQQRRLQGRRRRGSRSRTFQSAVTAPPVVRRGPSARKRVKDVALRPRKETERSQATRTRTARSRAERLQRVQRSVSTRTTAGPSVAVWQRIPWRAVAWRLAAAAVLAMLLGVIAFASSDVNFFVYRDNTRIEGARHLPADEIFAVAAVNELNIFWIDPAEVAERIVAMHGIKAARVRCELPARVVIEVEEREPVVMWRATSQEQDLWLDEAGVVLPYHGDVNAPDMVFVVDYGERQLQVGDRIEPEGIVQSVLQLAAALPGEQVYYYQPERGLSFTHRVSSGQWPVYVGTSDNLARKIQVVQALTEYLVANNISPRYVDVRWPEHPVYGRPGGITTVEGD